MAGGAMMLLTGTLRGEWGSLDSPYVAHVRPHRIRSTCSTIGAIGGFVAYTRAAAPARSMVSLTRTSIPIIAVALGVAVELCESLHPRMALAAALVFGGVAIVRRRRSDPAAADQSHEEEHDRDDQQHVDEVAQRVAADHTEQPQNDENDRNRFEHLFVSLAPRRLSGVIAPNPATDVPRKSPSRGVPTRCS